MSAKKWLILWIMSLFSILFIAFFNYKIDSLGLVRDDGYLDLAAKDIVNGKIVAGLKNFDDRLFVKKVITYLKSDLDFVAIGSSRTMLLRKRIFLNKNKKFYNFSVSGASLEDYMAILETYYDKFNKYPKNIILGIDPWIFNKFNNQKRYLSLIEQYNNFLKKINYPILENSSKTRNINKLISIEYLKENILFVYENYNNGLKGYSVVNSIKIDALLREPDGSIHYPYKDRFPNPNEVKKMAINYTKNNVYSLEKFNKLYNKNLFKKFINFLQTKGVNIYFYLPPYHPHVHNILTSKKPYSIIKDVEVFLQNISKQYNIKVIGSYNPHVYNFTNEHFFDGMHPLDVVCRKLFINFKPKK